MQNLRRFSDKPFFVFVTYRPPIRHAEAALIPTAEMVLGADYITFDPFSQMISKHSDPEMLNQNKATAQ